METENKNELEKIRESYKLQGKRSEQITYGMLCGNFQSIEGIPDEFCSAEDPDDRVRLWKERKPRNYESNSEGEYKGYGEFRD